MRSSSCPVPNQNQKIMSSSSPFNSSMASFSQPPLLSSSLVPITNYKPPLAFFSSQSQPTKESPTFKYSKIASSISEPYQENSPQSQPNEVDPVKLAFAKAKAYKNSKQFSPTTPNTTIQEPYANVTGKNGDGPSADVDDVSKEVPLAVKLALEKAKEYRKSKTLKLSEKSGLRKGGDGENIGNNQSVKNSVKNKDELTVSSIDFMGLGFSDKKIGRGLPAGLVPQSDPFSEGELPEVEILVGDTSWFDDALTASNKIPVDENEADVYKPKVSTWGVFPRPSNISKTYGGGKTIRPGEALETADERAAKEARTKQLVTAYKSKIGLNIDPKVKSECEKALNDGDSLMDRGKLNEALTFYEKVMEKLVFQSELHGLAALQWSICQDSLSRPKEAHVMYEKLQSHPSPKVSKRARQFVFSFQAMEMMKVTSFNSSQLSTDYQNYFDAFVQDKKNYPSKEAEADEGGLNQALPYIIFLVSPFFMVLLVAVSKSQ